jgi:hypothetical protein
MGRTVQSSGDNAIDPALMAQMQEACDRIAHGIFPTMEERKAAAAKVDTLREDNARAFGIQNVTLDAIRASRSSR